MSAISFILAYLATGAALAVLAPVVGIGQIESSFGNGQQFQFMRAVVATYFFVGSIVVTALLWPGLIMLAIHYHNKQDDDDDQ